MKLVIVLDLFVGCGELVFGGRVAHPTSQRRRTDQLSSTLPHSARQHVRRGRLQYTILRLRYCQNAWRFVWKADGKLVRSLRLIRAI